MNFLSDSKVPVVYPMSGEIYTPDGLFRTIEFELAGKCKSGSINTLSLSLIDSREEEIGEVEVGRLRSTMSYEYYSSSHDRSSDTVVPCTGMFQSMK